MGSRSKKDDSGPPIFEGQIIQQGSKPSSGPVASGGGGAATASGEVVAPEALGLPTDEASVIRYLTNSYKGVGEKTAEALVEELGGDLFSVLQRQPGRVRDVLPANRADQLLEAWREDLSRRKEDAGDGD